VFRQHPPPKGIRPLCAGHRGFIMDVEKVLVSFGFDPKEYGLGPTENETPVHTEIQPVRTVSPTPERSTQLKTAPAPVPAVSKLNFTKGFVQKESPAAPCLCCRSWKYFKLKVDIGPWVCAVCHPPRVDPAELLWEEI